MRIKHFLFTTALLVTVALTASAQTDALKPGNALVAQQKYKQAIEAYSKVSPRDRDAYPRAIYNIGVCYYELWQTDDAIAFYKRAIELRQGNYPKASLALGIALDDQNRTSEAKEAYAQALSASQGEFGPAIYRLGLSEAKAGNVEKAAALYRDAIARPGAHAPASHNDLGVMLVQLGFMKEAEKEFLIALKLTNNNFADAAHNLDLCRSLSAVAQKDYRLSSVSLN